MPAEKPRMVEVPEEIAHIFGERLDGTLMYESSGSEGEAGPWYEAVMEVAGRCVSPGGANMFAPVSRAAVHKRIKEGKMTAFCFYVTKTRKSIFGKQRQTRDMPHVYVPVCELKLWAKELDERMIRLGRVTREELEGDKPDWEGEFWKWDSKWQKQKREGKA